MVQSHTDQHQVGEIYKPRPCRMVITDVAHYDYDVKSSKWIYQAKKYQVKVRLVNQREHCLKQKTRVFDMC